jgi:hypothetical protein
MTRQEEQALKNSFLQRNPLAVTGIPAATRRNKLYSDSITAEKKKEIISFWNATMDVLAKKYGKRQNRDTFIKDIRSLMRIMNKEFKESLAPSGFRFSHAQKSFSVLLKYRWCNGTVQMPPLCPIDRNVLHKMDAPYKYSCWTKMREPAYANVYDNLEKMAEAEKCTVAQLELKWFEHI